MEVLTAFIRQYSREPWPPPVHPASGEPDQPTPGRNREIEFIEDLGVLAGQRQPSYATSSTDSPLPVPEGGYSRRVV